MEKRDTVSDSPMGPKQPSSTVLSLKQEALIVTFRKHTLMPLDDCLYALRASIPNLTRSPLHRCLKRHGISHLPECTGDKPPRDKFKPYSISFSHIDIAEVRTEGVKLHLFVAIDRTSKLAMAQLFPRSTMATAKDFIRSISRWLITVFSSPTCRRIVLATPPCLWANDIEHGLTKPNLPWTNGQVERINRTLKEATANRYYYQSHQQLHEYLHAFISIYNLAKRLR